MVRSNGDEFVFMFLKCKIVAMFLQFKKREICCKFVVLFWNVKL